MPAPGHAGHWKKPDGSTPLQFERGSFVATPSGRKARIRQYWTNPSHEYVGCAAILYEDTGDTAVISMTLLKQWREGVIYTPPPLVKIKPIPAPVEKQVRVGGLVLCASCPCLHKKVRPAKVADCQLSFPFFEAAA